VLILYILKNTMGAIVEELNENKQKKQLSSDELSCFYFL